MVKTGWTHAGLSINPGFTTHSLANRELHAARRRLLNNAFSDRAMSSLDTYIVARIRDWCAYLGQPANGNHDEKAGSWGKPRDMGVWSTLLTIDVLGELCFGNNFGAMKEGGCYIMDLLLSSARFQQCVAFLPPREVLFPFMKPHHLIFIGRLTGSQSLLNKVRFRQDIGKLVEKRFAVEKADSTKAEEEKRKDFFYYLLHAKDPTTGDKFLPADLVGEAALLVGAGSDTSSTAISALFFYLVRNERALRKLSEEVRNTFSDIEEIKYSAKLTDLSYLRACIDEAMRMSPPVPGLLDRLVLPGGAMIDGHMIPEGTTVGVPIYAAHHNEAYYPKPFEYIPERWIAGDDSTKTAGFLVTPTSVEVAKSAFHAFSSGPRGCVGKNMAYIEMFTAIARAVFLFDMRLQPGDHTGEGSGEAGEGRQRTNEYQLVDWLISDREGPVVEFKRREGVTVPSVAAAA
jgi:cytochrome P450